MTSFARICIWIVFVNFTILLSKAKLKSKRVVLKMILFWVSWSIYRRGLQHCQRNPWQNFTSIWRPINAWPAISSCMHGRNEKFAFRSLPTEGVQMKKVPAPQLVRIFTADVHSISLKHVLQVKLFLWKAVGKGNFLECILLWSPQNDSIFDRELSIAIHAVWLCFTFSKTSCTRWLFTKKKNLDVGSLWILSFLASPSWKVCPDKHLYQNWTVIFSNNDNLIWWRRNNFSCMNSFENMLLCNVCNIFITSCYGTE